MNDIRTYISDALKDSIYACDKDSLDYYYRCPEAADYFASFTDGVNLYNSDCYYCEETKVCAMEEVEEVWDDVLRSVLIDFALSNMSDDDLEEGTITEEWTEEFDEDKCVSLGNVFVGYELPKYAEEVLDQTWDLCGTSEEHGAVYAIPIVLNYLYNEGKIGSGKDEIPLAGVAKFFGATHVAFLEETEVHGAIYSFYRYKTASFNFDKEIKSAVEHACYDEEGANRFGGWFLPVWIGINSDTNKISFSHSDICSGGTMWNGEQPLYKIDVWHTYWQPDDAESWAWECNREPEEFDYDEIHQQDIDDAASNYYLETGDLSHYAEGQEYVLVAEVLTEENKKEYPELYAICEAAASYGYGRVDLD